MPLLEKVVTTKTKFFISEKIFKFVKFSCTCKIMAYRNRNGFIGGYSQIQTTNIILK